MNKNSPTHCSSKKCQKRFYQHFSINGFLRPYTWCQTKQPLYVQNFWHCEIREKQN